VTFKPPADQSLDYAERWLLDGLRAKDPDRTDMIDCLEESDSGFGRLSSVKHPAMLSETPPHWARPSVPLGTHPPVWPRD